MNAAHNADKQVTASSAAGAPLFLNLQRLSVSEMSNWGGGRGGRCIGRWDTSIVTETDELARVTRRIVA